jgi:hypothetical protein
MKTLYFAIAVSCCFLNGCTLAMHWYLNARKDGDTVQLCLSNELMCPQPDGVSPSGIGVYRYDNVYNNVLVWDAWPDTPIANRISGIVTFGIPPKGWTNKTTPPPIVCGRAYLVTPGETFFALKCDGSVVTFDFQHLDEFFRQNPGLPLTTKPANDH